MAWKLLLILIPLIVGCARHQPTIVTSFTYTHQDMTVKVEVSNEH